MSTGGRSWPAALSGARMVRASALSQALGRPRQSDGAVGRCRLERLIQLTAFVKGASTRAVVPPPSRMQIAVAGADDDLQQTTRPYTRLIDR